MKLGIYGGTFDPIHTGHLILAESVRSQLKLDKILFIPAAIPPHKTESKITSPEIRYEMLQLAVADNPYFQVSSLEIQRTGVSYTINTIKTIHEQMQLQREELYFILGADNILGFPTWHKPDEILELCHIVVLPRPEIDLKNIHPMLQNKIIIVKTPIIEISSSVIRQLSKQGRSIRYLVPESIFQYLQRNQLYQL
ncbi:nicotinate-nucleotide adenylyltransferase [candidate division KSB1 bacterium]|nr:nicotinate-nucleotide adenylyltransferase [candidate division KSB1 bacterium]